jgi:hypothetical protein
MARRSSSPRPSSAGCCRTWLIEFGPGGRERVELRPDGTVYVVPPGLVHREVNTGATRNLAFVVRVGTGPSAVEVPGPL